MVLTVDGEPAEGLVKPFYRDDGIIKIIFIIIIMIIKTRWPWMGGVGEQVVKCV